MTEKTEMQIEQDQDSLIDIQSGIFIYIHRRIRFLKQEDLEEKTKVTRSCISLMEHGHRDSRISYFKRILSFFGFSIGSGFTIIEDKNLMKEHLENFRIICNVKQENVDALYAYWSDTPPIEEKDPILKFFPPMNLKKSKKQR